MATSTPYSSTDGICGGATNSQPKGCETILIAYTSNGLQDMEKLDRIRRMTPIDTMFLFGGKTPVCMVYEDLPKLEQKGLAKTIDTDMELIDFDPVAQMGAYGLHLMVKPSGQSRYLIPQKFTFGIREDRLEGRVSGYIDESGVVGSQVFYLNAEDQHVLEVGQDEAVLIAYQKGKGKDGLSMRYVMLEQ
jgi:hypothetical protein